MTARRRLLAAAGDVALSGAGPRAVVEPPEGALALALAQWAAAAGGHGLLHVTRSDTRADRLALAVAAVAPNVEVLVLPPWDCLPYDRVAPSPAVMGQRIATLARLAEPPPPGGRLLLAAAEAVVQRVPPFALWRDAIFTITAGGPLAVDAFKLYLLRAGYVLDERVDEPGEVAFRGDVVDLFPGDAPQPVRLRLEDGTVAAIHRYDPVSQRSEAEVDVVVLQPVSEVLLDADLVRRRLDEDDDAGSTDEAADHPAHAQVLIGPPAALHRAPGLEHRLAQFYDHLESVFDRLAEARVVIDADVEDRLDAWFEQIAESYQRRRAMRAVPDGMAGSGAVRAVMPSAPSLLYLDRDAWAGQLAARPIIRLTELAEDGVVDLGAAPLPRFRDEDDPARALTRFLDGLRGEGHRVVLVATTEPERRRLATLVERYSGSRIPCVDRWAEIEQAAPGSTTSVMAPLAAGFTTAADVVVTAADVFGASAAAAGTSAAKGASGADPFGLSTMGPGDLVVHAEHGVGVLAGLERLEQDAATHECLAIEYGGGHKLLVPAEEIGALWRYGSADAGIARDRLSGEAWARRKAEVEAQVAEAADALVDLAGKRAHATAPRLQASPALYRRFVARFRFAETRDQAGAIEAVRRDLASGRPMDRLVCGDVGFGKTEVALRAAAIAAFAGKQVALVAPTTVLVRQHLETFRRRFAGFGIRVEALARTGRAAAARTVTNGLADGSIGIVIGTQALAGPKLRFHDLGLVIVDEEQRFGTGHKEQLRALRAGNHLLTLTATPIPRTLQAARAGVIDLSIIATPPVRRRPVRTFVLPFDPVVVREALLREESHGGQSFVVCPRIADLEPMRARLAELVPELDIVVAHGRMKADVLDGIMVAFADGAHDVLLTTNIIESGLDIPSANTMLVWRPDRFGLADLHQLRGRVGRGRARSAAYLLLDPEARVAPATERRLRTLQTLEGLGAGFAIGARDLDLRGAGDLLGDDQAGHLRLVGTELYEHLLERAVRRVQGQADDDEWTPQIRIGLGLSIPADYVPETENRIDLYRRLTKLGSAGEVDALADELADRFGALPVAMHDTLALVRLGQRCRHAGVARIEGGPNGIALSFRNAGSATAARIGDSAGEARWQGERLILPIATASPAERLAAACRLLNQLEDPEAVGQ